MNRKLYTLTAFSITDVIGINKLNKIEDHFEDIYDFLDCDTKYQMEFLNLKSDKIESIFKNIKKQTDLVLEKCEKQDIDLISYDDIRYPPLLKEISDAPYLLYVKGNLNPKIPLIAVIGTRKSTADAEAINRTYCKSFVNYGIGIVSGLAHGHDSIAAKSALDYEGYTIGVLGTAIDVVYPASSSYLYKKIIEEGALISEYPPGITSTKWRFPRRNRIVSGISQAVFVVQAPKKSGTMITVKMAEEQGKDVYALPGNPLIPEYEGTNSLIQQGAKIALNPQEIIEDILKSNPNIETMQFLAEHKNSKKKDKIEILDLPLSENEKQILELLSEQLHIDEIAKMSEINIATLNSLLTMMEIKGLIIQKPGQLYKRENL